MDSIVCDYIHNGLIYNNNVIVEENIFPYSNYRPEGIELNHCHNMIIKRII